MGVIYVGTQNFPITPNPPAGDFYLGLNTANSNHLTKQSSAGALTDYESGAVYADPQAVAAVKADILTLAQKELPAMDDFVMLRDVVGGDYKQATKAGLLKADPDRFYSNSSDFMGTITGDLVASNAGTGASSQSGTYGEDNTERAIGVIQYDTGTTTTGRAGLGAVSTNALAVAQTALRFAARVAMEALSNPTETFVKLIGFGQFYNQAGEGTNGLYFRYTDLQNGGRWEAVSRGGGADLTAIDTGVAPDLDYHVFEIRVNEAGNLAQFFIDGNEVAQITNPSLLPSAIQRFGYGVQIRKTAGTTQRNADIDWYLIETKRSSVR